MPNSHWFNESDKKLLDHLLRIHGKPEKGHGNQIKHYRKLAKLFNSLTNGSSRTPVQIRNYVSNRKRGKMRKVKGEKPTKVVARADESLIPAQQALPPPPSHAVVHSPLPSASHHTSSSLLAVQQTPSELVCKNIRSLSSPKKQKLSIASSPSGYVGSAPEFQEEYRSLADDLPASWEYTEISSSFLAPANDHGSPENHDEPHIFDDIDDFSLGRTSAPQEKNGMSSDLVSILAEQTRQHHRLKMKLLKEKFRKVAEFYKMKMCILENELEMKRKEHERKMDVLAQKYRKIKDNADE